MRPFARYALSALCLALLTPPSWGRINVFEPWLPGQDTAVGGVYTHEMRAGLLFGERLIEVPFYFTYVSSPKLEAGGKWGVRSAGGNVGISDMLIGLKYQLLEGGGHNPGVIGETAVSLPTGDAARGIGSGAVSLLMNWGLEKRIETVTGYFGLGVRLNSESSTGIQEGNVFSYHAGVGYPYREQMRLYGELKGFNHGITKIRGAETGTTFQELYLAPGIDYAYSAKTTISASLLIGLTPEAHDIGFAVSGNF